MDITPTGLMTPIKTHDNPSAPQLDKTSKALVITQIALLALAVIGAISFVIATAVTLNAYLLIGAGLCGIVAFAILGRNLCCRSIANREETIFLPRHDDLYNEQVFVHGFHKKSPLFSRQIAWPETRISSGRVLPGQR